MSGGPVHDFMEAMAEQGLASPREVVADGKIHRFKPVGEKSQSLPGWYLLHLDGVPAGSFGSWKTGEKHSWCAKRENKLTERERHELEVKKAQDRKQRDEEQDRVHKAAQIKCERLWAKAHKASDDHPYLKRKQIHAPGTIRQLRESLLIPMRDSTGILHSIQWISPSGKKIFATGGYVNGCYATIGRPKQRLIICEGFATGVSIFEATGDAVAIAFTAGNLERVARAMREKFPALELVIAADNDQFTTAPIANPGVHYASLAATRSGSRLCFPAFSDISTRPTDFNDLALLEGHARVCDLIDEAREPGAEPPTSPEPQAPQAGSDDKPPIAVDQSPPSLLSDEPADMLAIVDLREIDTFSPLPDVKGKKPLATLENLAEIMRRLDVTPRYNVIKKEEELLIPGQQFSIDNKANAANSWITSWCARFLMPTGLITQYVSALADRNLFNPAAAWITSKPWDTKSRLQEFFNTVRERNPERKTLKEILIRRWLISCVAAVFEPRGVSAHGVLVFQAKQYLGKTAWFKRLVPQDLGLTADGIMLKPDDKDSIGQALSFWLIELGELDATFRKSDIAQLKAFVTRDKDIFRKPYMPKPSEFARRTAFFASVNDERFLQDPTGNRRFWTIGCDGLDFNHSVDMQQLWAEVKTLYDFGEPWVLSEDEMRMLNESNEEFQSIDPIEDKLLTAFKWHELEVSNVWMSVTEALEQAGWSKPSQSELNRAGSIIRKLNGGRHRTYDGKRQLWMPLKV